MNGERPVYLSEEEAERLWKRAAELQVRESRKVEERSRDLRAPPGPSGFPAGSNLPLNEVLFAAREVGIGEAHLEAAVAELLEERAQGGAPAPDLIERIAARFFGSPPPALEATAVLESSPREVYHILQLLLPSEPYCLRLRWMLGEDPLRDGVLVFDAPDQGKSPNAYARSILMAEDRVRRLYVTLRATTGGAAPACRITVRARIQADPEPAFWMGSLATLGGAGVGGVLGAIIATGVGLAGPLLALPVAGLAALSGGATYGSVRSRYLEPLFRSQGGLEELLDVVEAAVKTEGSFLPRELRRPQVDDGAGRRSSRP
jgi:hypothetical protein